MKKVFLIGWYDMILAFRDRAALILMLAAPFALTLGLGFVTGRFSGSASSGLSRIPVVIVNQDGGQLGDALVELFRSQELERLVAPTLLTDPALARQYVDQDRVAAAIIIPAGFTQSIIAAPGSASPGDVVQIALYANPTRPTSSGVVKTIVEEFVSRVEVGRAGAQVAVAQLLRQGLIGPQEAARVGSEVGARQAVQKSSSVAIRTSTASSTPVEFDALAYMAPGMALMFLMFTVANGGRTLLAERARGTLPRLLISPSASWQVLGGKVFGTYLTGVAQMLILIVASALLFRLSWGDPLPVLALVLAAVAGAAGWGLLITALARTPGQVSTVGTALMLTFGILGGSFINIDMMPGWFALLSRITPNAWGLDGFATLAMGGGLADILGDLVGLLIMGGLLFAIAAFILRRRGLAEA